MLRAIKDAAASLSVTVRAVPFRDDAEIEVIMAGLASEERGGLLVLQDASAIAHRNTIVALAARHRLPAVYPYRFITALGGLIVKRQAIGTPDRHRKGTPHRRWDRLVPVANRRVPRASRSALTSDGAARVGGACCPPGQAGVALRRGV